MSAAHSRPIVHEYEPHRASILESSPSVRRIGSNPLSSLDYLTADLGHVTGSSTVGYDRGQSGQGGMGGNLDNVLINKIRKISSAPYKILDAPALCDDFYLNLVDWSPLNTLAVALA